MVATQPAAQKPRTFFGHPPMLANLFTVEMWERFSFYGMQALALYYLYHSIEDGGLGIPKEAATGAMGAYGATVYLMAILGGILGDRVLGPERTLFYSAIGIMAGHIVLAVMPGAAGVITGLLLVAIGSGCLKSSASVLVGSLYSKDDPKREAGFTLFYIGINIGALLGPALTGWGWGWLGFHFGFGIAAIGMAAGLIQYVLTRKNLPESVHEVTVPFTPRQNGILSRCSGRYSSHNIPAGHDGLDDYRQPRHVGGKRRRHRGHSSLYSVAHRQERNQHRTLAGVGVYSPLDCQRYFLGALPAAVHGHSHLF